MVVGVDPGGRGGLRGGPATDDIGGVQRFTEHLGVTYPVGIEQTANYGAFAENYRGANPFPLDVIVDRDGTIAYVAREYDPEALAAVIEELLARPAERLHEPAEEPGDEPTSPSDSDRPR
jgi:hypothetical protein